MKLILNIEIIINKILLLTCFDIPPNYQICFILTLHYDVWDLIYALMLA